jgi:putative hemolysin
MDTPGLSVIVPAYNEEASIVSVLAGIRETMQHAQFTYLPWRRGFVCCAIARIKAMAPH